MPINVINAVLLIAGTCATLTGLAEKVAHRPAAVHPPKLPRWTQVRLFVKRVRPLGWAFLFCVVLSFGLGVYKEYISFEGQVTAATPNFYPLVKGVTGYSQDEWTKVFSYRLSIRSLLQKLYGRTFHPNSKSSPSHSPDSIKVMLTDLGERGVLDADHCKDLNSLAYYTYTSEWGRGEAPTVKELNWVYCNSDRILRDLATLTDNPALQNSPNAVCGQEGKRTDVELQCTK